jgi:hypothetical protein
MLQHRGLSCACRVMMMMMMLSEVYSPLMIESLLKCIHSDALK